jgi:uncharacterized DUF497 family protein
VEFEFDPRKSAQTKADPNRGIDFVEAQALFSDPYLLEIPLPFETEPRMAMIGKIEAKIWTAITTRRGDKVRIISVRRAHKSEEKLYVQS